MEISPILTKNIQKTENKLNENQEYKKPKKKKKIQN